MLENPYMQNMVDRLKSIRKNIHFYIDERGVAAVDELFVIGGLIVHGDHDEFQKEWSDFTHISKLQNKKGKRFSESDLLKVNEFLIGKPVFPVVVFSRIGKDEIDELKDFARLYENSKYERKKFKKISAASWLRKAQVTTVIGTGIAEFNNHVGGIGHASIYFDPITDTPGMHEHVEHLLHKKVANAQYPTNKIISPALAKLLNDAQPSSWSISMNARGKILDLADIICTMFGHCIDGNYCSSWEVLTLEHRVSENLKPLALGNDVSEGVKNWLERLYEQRPVLEAHLPKSYKAKLKGRS